MSTKTLLCVALCLFGMFAVPYFMTQPTFMEGVCTDVLGTNSTEFGDVPVWATLGALAVGFGSYFYLLVKSIVKKSHLVWVVVAGFVYVPLLLFYVFDSMLPYLVPDL